MLPTGHSTHVGSPGEFLFFGVGTRGAERGSGSLPIPVGSLQVPTEKEGQKKAVSQTDPCEGVQEIHWESHGAVGRLSKGGGRNGTSNPSRRAVAVVATSPSHNDWAPVNTVTPPYFVMGDANVTSTTPSKGAVRL